MGLFDFLTKAKSKSFSQIVVQTFYSDYPEIPYVSEDRPHEWLQNATAFPKQTLVPRSMMKRYADGLLPGHIYMLYWLKRYSNKKVPSYFEYKYGLNFDVEVSFLLDNGYLNGERKPTEKGEAAIKKHYTVIEKHSAKPGATNKDVAAQMRSQLNSFKRNGFTHYEFIASRSACEVCKQLGGKHFPLASFEIGVTAPPMHDGCSCSIAAWEDPVEYDAWLNSISKGETTKK